ncbi:MAG: right-handed parallel beta-helix repeat-containing protein [Planctomycetota bacterium]|nr:right-handed parallel beta-helix repeat-containing protein [Planctomycetota bacterium]
MLANTQSVWSATAGDSVNIQYWANDRDVTNGNTTLTFGTDNDQNPYNGVLATLPSAGVESVSTTTGNGQPHVYSWRPNTSDDEHYFYAKITDAEINGATRTRYYYLPKPFTITAPPPNTVAPTASIPSPPPNPASGTVSVAATATAANGQAISRVAFLLDGNVAFTDYSAPYLWNWDTAQTVNGAHKIQVTAYDTSGLSGNSAPVTVTINNGGDIRPPVISHLSATTSSATAVFTWNTDEPATAQVEYGTSPTPPNSGYSPPNLSLLTTHSITLTNLSPGTTYYGRVFDRDAASNLAYSGNIAFVTSSTANTAPQITLGQPAAGAVWAANTLQTITWSAFDDVAVTGISLYYSTDYGAHWNLIAGNVANTGRYVWTVSNINSTTVRIRAVAFDGAGASGEDTGSGDFTVTPSNPVPATPILDTIVPDRAAYTVSWSTVAGATYILEEDTSAAFTNPVRYSLCATSRFFYNRLPGTYYCRVSATNVYGQSNPSSPQAVTLNYDLGPGTIGALTPADGATAQPLAVTLNWSVSNPGGHALRFTIYVAMGDTDSYFPVNVRASDQTSTSLAVTNLPYNTTISWGVRATDASGLVTWSPMFHFETVADATPPTGSISINNGAINTDTYAVTLFPNATDVESGVQAARFISDGNSWTLWNYLAPQVAWNLADNRYGGRTGLSADTVYAQFMDAQGNVSAVSTATINKVAAKPGNIILNGRIFATIQEAINAAQPGDTVYLTEGTYSVTGNTSALRPWDANRMVGIVMRRGVTLRGAGADKTTISFDQSYYGIVDSDNAVIEGLTLVNPSFPGSMPGVVLLESNSSVVRNCLVRGGSYTGIYVGNNTGHQASNSLVANNTILNNGGPGIQVASDASNVFLFNNTIAYNRNGIFCRVSSVSIINNVVAFNEANIAVWAVPIIRYNDVYLLTGENYSGIADQTGINGNISVDPRFNNASAGDYHLASDSPCIDSGTYVGIRYAGAPSLGAFETNARGTVKVTSNRSDASFTIVGPEGTYSGSGTSWSWPVCRSASTP